MLTVYFDRNVFADICELRNGLTDGDVAKIKNAVESGSITIPASTTIFEETIGILRESEDKFDQHIKTVLGLIDKRRMVKQPKDLLSDDCYYFAVGLPENVRTMSTPRRLRELLDVSKNRADLLKLEKEVSNFFGGAASSVTGALLKAREFGLQKNVGRPKDFHELWNGISGTIVESLVDRCPKEIRKKCIKRGLKRMLDVKSIRFYTIYYVSVIHSGWFGVQDVPRKVKAGDFGDWFHAIQASVANIFVTQESKTRPGKLPFILNQLPTPGFAIMNLQEFLQQIYYSRGAA